MVLKKIQQPRNIKLGVYAGITVENVKIFVSEDL